MKPVGQALWPPTGERLHLATQETFLSSISPGPLWAIDLTTGDRTVFGEFQRIGDPPRIAGPGRMTKRGFLGVAFDPISGQRVLYTFTSEPVAGAADFSTLPTGTAPNFKRDQGMHVSAPTNPESGCGSAVHGSASNRQAQFTIMGEA